MPFQDNLILATYCVPTASGKVRPLATVLRKKGSPWGSTLSERALAVFMGPIQTPAWFGHVASSVVLHQDAGLLYNQCITICAARGMNRPALVPLPGVRVVPNPMVR
eukprot:CAMPEP_0194381608 /NCGR_PEP_ID=MMETSP0174-20130528/54353_1 /TAXON_ID=216777 /ORGANISM="Proboscia alata, Strain PI-D3" /LENGTH=106 /DNA_ID=CAMNT_0039166123 /DNA_START=204 /DNA_END=524 /DNA_ORIENTATION=+